MDTPPCSHPKKQCPGARRNHREWYPFGHGKGLQMIDGVYYCNCKTPQKLSAQQVMSNRNGNQGRWYYNCPSWDPKDNSGCGLYAFEDELEEKHRMYEREWKYEPCETSWWIDPTTKPLEGETPSAHLPGSQHDGEERDKDEGDEVIHTATENSPAPTFAFQAPLQWIGSQTKKYKQLYLVALPNDGVSISSGTSTVMNGLESFELSSQQSYQSASNSVTSPPAKVPRNTLISSEPGSGSSSKRQRGTKLDELPSTPTTSRTVIGLYAPQIRSIEEEDEDLEDDEAAAPVNRLLFPLSSQASSLDRVVEVVEKIQRDIAELKERDRMRSSQETVGPVRESVKV